MEQLAEHFIHLRCAVSYLRSFPFPVIASLLIVLSACGGGNGQSPSSPGSPGTQSTTTLAAETGNDTSAADSFRAQTNGNAGAGNVSKLPIQSLLYAGATTKIYAHLVGWFGGSDHMSVGYQSDDAGQVHRQVVDMMSRGIQGVIIDWHGPASTRINTASTLMRKEAEAQNGQFTFAIMEDVGSLAAAAVSNQCDVTNQAISDLNLIVNQFAVSSAYLRSGGRPVIFFFGVDTYYIDWNRVASSISGNPILIFRDKSGLSHSQTGGAFQWVDDNSTNPFDPELFDLDQFYSAALADPSQVAFGTGYAGFNDTLAGWSTDRFIDRSCGQTWLATMNEASKFYSDSNQLASLQLVTWNDYEEGTELETGIDNCVFVTPSVSGSTLKWTVAGGSENTVDHYTVFMSTDGQNLTKLGDVGSGTHSFDLSAVTQTAYKLYVKAVGRASFQNKMSPVIMNQKGDQPPVAAVALTQTASLTLKGSTDGSSDPDGSVASSTIDFGDGTTMNGPDASHTYAAPGTYTIVATVVDNAGASAVAVKQFSVKASAGGVTIFTPANGATINWPTSFTASANSAAPVSSMTLLVDGQAVYATHSDIINTSLKIFRGPHHIVVQATDTAGTTSSSAIDVTAEPTDQTPVAAVTVLPLPAVAPNAVLACTAGSQDPDGFINATQVSFSDGTTIKSVGAVHTFAAPGTYSATATVTDQFGATDSASGTFMAGGASGTHVTDDEPRP
jgi:hypothetical protein